MTRTEQAAFKRLDKRRDDLFTGLAIIETWITARFDTPQGLLYKISQLCTEKIENERAAILKEELRNKTHTP